MTSPEERIKELARKHAIDPAAAERLLAAVRPEPVARSSWNPYARWSAERCVVVGLIAAAIGIATSRLLPVRADGALDMGRTATPVSLGGAVLAQLGGFPGTALVLWAIGRLFAPKIRPIDMLGTVGLARLPITLAVLPLAYVDTGSPDEASPTVLQWFGTGLLLLGAGIQICLLVFGFGTATALRGRRLAVAFLSSLVAAEVISKVVLHFVRL
jgi:hypothetical protein